MAYSTVTTTVVSSADAGLENRTGASYASVHDAASCSKLSPNQTQLIIGQLASGDPVVYRVTRWGLNFDTSSIPSGDKIVSATLKIYKNAGPYDMSGQNYTIVDGSDLGAPPVADDYGDLLDDVTSWGSIAASTLATGSYSNIDINAIGLSGITRAGTTKLAVRSSTDIASTAPTTHEYTLFEASGTASNPPTLVVIHQPLQAARYGFATYA